MGFDPAAGTARQGLPVATIGVHYLGWPVDGDLVAVGVLLALLDRDTGIASPFRFVLADDVLVDVDDSFHEDS
jgi:hypothetical protein